MTAQLHKAEPSRPHHRPRWKILVVEDNKDSAETLSFLLADMGHDTRFSFSAEGAIAMARLFKPDVVLLDLVLGDAEGHEVAREIRRTPACGNTRIYAVTARNGEEDRRKSREAGFDGYFIKPLDAPFLDTLLSQHV